MGCTQSKIENEEAVTRCKQRKLFMKEAVAARNAFAAAHSAYAMSLKNTGAALSDYSHGEVQNSHIAAATSHPPSDAAVAAAAAAQPPFDPLLPPPPPPSLTTFPAPIQRAASMPEMKIPKTRELGNGVAPTIVEENDFDVEEEEEVERDEKLVMRKRSSGRNKSGDHQKEAPALERAPPPAVVNSGSVQAVQDWDYWFPPVDSIPGTSLEVKVEEKETVESKVLDEIKKREEYVEEKPKEVPPTPPLMVEDVVDEKVVVAAASGGGSVGRNVKRGKSAAGTGEKRGVKGSLNLLQVFVELDDHFLKASESAHDVSKMLEATRLHYHSNFADNRGYCLV